ncbi:sodium:solute symporter [candidate division KSB1 bacterium]|nr:sodium:solute symporter [candidate division KSB1 bacterium]NIR70093.1 sodium:solute symporter [candidate division KSB1 bacterium]NIS27518.1 sodium:solute symporter [candidate division KSB1 bacterium]NIT74369.1 sodium:solute symporter [candidate division KSB1 bacterium]NIU28236.1 sodium:solute symporter [candidate division KSB1 bacterium]
MGFSTIDMAIVVVYMMASAGVGAWIGRHQKNTTDYFLGNRQIPWLAVTFSIVATETSVLTFISIPAVSYQGNLTFLQIAFGYVVGRILVALYLIPAYFRGEMNTAYHFLGERFGQKMRNTASITFMATRVLADGVRLFATAIPLALIIKGSGAFIGLRDGQFYAISILLIGVLTIIYTYVGGIRSVIWMDVVQMTIYIGGAILAAILILGNLPNGFTTVTELAASDEKLKWFYTGYDLAWKDFIKQPYTFFTALTAGAVFSLASHGTDQITVQRLLTCKDKLSSQKAISASGFAVLVQFLIFLILGNMLYAYYGGANYQELGLTRADGIFPKFIVEEMPTGVSGLIVAALFAAAMSTLSSSLSSLSSAAILDIYLPLAGKDKSEAQLLKISRLATLGWGIVLVVAALAFIGLKGTVVEVALGIASYTYGGLLGSFLLGLVHKDATQKDAIVGFASAVVVMTVVIGMVQIAWPLYTVVGSLTTILVGIGSHKFFAGGRNAG